MAKTYIPGARQFRILVLLVAGAAFVTLGVESIRHYLDYLHAVNDRSGQDIMRGVQAEGHADLLAVLVGARGSSIVVGGTQEHRVGCLLSVPDDPGRGCCPRILSRRPRASLSAVACNQLCHVRSKSRFARLSPFRQFRDGLSHDANHRRTTVNEGKIAEPKLIYVFGGSTTYDVGNRDSDTWPSQLSRLLGPEYDVENYGVPGFSSMEALGQSLFAFRDAHVACAVYYEGWNDLRNAHMAGLQSDYSDYEILYLNRALLLQSKPGFLQRNSLALAYAASLLAPAARGKPAGEISPRKGPPIMKSAKYRAARGHRTQVRRNGGLHSADCEPRGIAAGNARG